jgi:hypothetical protein
VVDYEPASRGQGPEGLSHYEEEGGGRLGFGRLLEVANSASSRDIRDKVYGLVGMMDPVIAERLAPDYKMDPRGYFPRLQRHLFSRMVI